VSGPPDFVGIGTHLAGGWWWADLLGAHPQVHPPADGEWSQEFFSPFCARPMQDADVVAYHARFPRPAAGVVGEWSPRYLYDAWTLPLLRRAAPDAKLLVLLRDPIERYQSALSYRLAEERRHGKWVSMTDVVNRGRYASQLEALYAFFAPEQVLVLQYEQCLAEPQAQYERTLAFLGVDATILPRGVRRLQRRQARPGVARRAIAALDLERSAPAEWVRRVRTGRPRVHVELWPDLLAALRFELQPEVAALARLAPEVDVRRWSGFQEADPAGAAADAARRERRPLLDTTRARVAAAGLALAGLMGAAAGILAATTELF